MTDALQAISENTANIAGGHYPVKRFADIYLSGKKKEETKETGEQIATDIIKKIAREGGES